MDKGIFLLLGGNKLNQGILRKFRDQGYLVYVIDWNEHPQLTGDRHYQIDVKDPAAIIAALKSHNEWDNVVFAYSSIDLAVPSVAAINHEIGLKTISRDGLQFSSSKSMMTQRWNERGLLNRISKHYREFSSEITEAGKAYKLIVKPDNSASSRGITILEKNAGEEELKKAFDKAKEEASDDIVVVEEFVQGTNHGFSAMLVKGKVVFAFADNEQYYINKYLVSGANTPSTTQKASLAKLREYSERIAHELHLVDGILHIQYIEKADGTPFIIEICRRPPGALYIKFVKYATGIDYPKFIVKAETGEDISSIADVPTQGFWLRHCVMSDREADENGCSGIVRDVSFAPEIQKNIVEKFLWFKPGETITDKLLYKAGIVFFKFDTLEEMTDKTARMTDLVKIVID